MIWLFWGLISLLVVVVLIISIFVWFGYILDKVTREEG